MVASCCYCAGAVAIIPMAVIISVLLETPTVTKLAGVSLEVSSDHVEESTGAGARLNDATEVSQKGKKEERMGSGTMFDRIAAVYDATNKWMSLGLDQHWRKTMVQECLRLEREDKVLDLATGTADVGLLEGERLKQLGDGSAPGESVLGVDPSPEMLRRGVSKVDDRGLAGVVRLVKGDAQDLSSVQGIDAAGVLSEPSVGLADGSVDKISMSFGIRNVPDRARALREMRRVLRPRPTSRVCILEFSLPSAEGFLSGIARNFVLHVVPFIGRIATMGAGAEEYEYLERSIIRFPQPLGFAAELTKAGLPVESITSFAYGAVNLYAATLPP